MVTTWDAIVNALGALAVLAFGVWVLTLLSIQSLADRLVGDPRTGGDAR